MYLTWESRSETDTPIYPYDSNVVSIPPIKYDVIELNLMFCGRCGREITGGICPYCDGGRKPKKSRAWMLATIAVTIVVVFIAISSIQLGQNGSDNITDPVIPTDPVEPSTPDTETIVPADPIVFDNSDTAGELTMVDPYDYFTVTSSEVDDGTRYEFTLNQSIYSKFDQFKWTIQNDNDFFDYGSTNIKTDHTATWTVKEGASGQYTLKVSCYSDSSIFVSTYSATVYIGEVTKTFEWTYEGQTQTFSISYPYTEYVGYSGTNGASYQKRAAYSNGTYDVIDDFMVINQTILDIEDELSNLYSSKYGSASGQGYAEYILTYVQACYGYMLDYMQYGAEEYFAFPMETINNGYGDCEDTSILCAVIFRAAGYESGVFLIPGHAIAAVSVDNIDVEAIPSEYATELSIFSMQYQGRTYYGCETTVDASSLYPIGWISSDYSVNSDGEIVYQGVVQDPSIDYGLYPLKLKN